MTTVSRRAFVGMAAAGAALAAGTSIRAGDSKAPGLTSLATNAKPISTEEFGARLAKLQSLMRERKVGAFLVESGTSLEYFTGIRWRRSERITAAVVPATGGIIVVTPFFEEPSIRELLKVPAEVRPWQEDENPFDLIARALRERAAEGPLAVEETTRFFIIDRMRKSSGPGRDVVSGEDLVRACRMIKSPAELALLQAANNITIAAIRHLHGQVEAGMQWTDILKLQIAATEALGGTHEFTLVLLNEASAFPHGSEKPQVVGKGSVILIDTGCSVHGYMSDISRTWVFGEPSARQREVWNTVKRGQEIAQETAKIGVPVGAIDKAVRAYYEGRGWSKDYRLPGTSHRTGHGIGMDVHEAPYLVRNDTTPLAAGMCFSDEPGIYIPGEFGVRMEDCWYMTDAGPKLFTALAASIDRPV
jgi:Xaa-Pro dipeptidase